MFFNFLFFFFSSRRRHTRWLNVTGVQTCALPIWFADNSPVKMGDVIVEWDPYTFSILTEVGGTVQFKDLEQGVTLHEEVDEVTGLSRWVVTDSPDQEHQPQVVIRSDKAAAKAVRKYLMPSRSHLMVQDGDEVLPGDVLAKIPRET